MKILYLDCGMGAAGDMLSAALLELLPDPAAFLDRVNGLGLPGVAVRRKDAVKCGIRGTHLAVTVEGREEDAPDGHTHGHTHAHGHDCDPAHGHSHEHPRHEHHSLGDVEALAASLPLPEKVRRDLLAVYALLARAESEAHGMPVEQIHFHEVGTLDAVADIAMTCLLMAELSPERVVVSPVHVGCGKVRCAHGLLPVPAPATANLLRGVPIYGGGIEGELCTPTGAALLRHFATEFGPMPVMRVEKIGYGMGRKDFPAANCLRAMLGEAGEGGETVVELRCNVDDMTPEAVGFAIDRLWEGGALEVYTIPLQMKKSRPGVLLSVMCREERREELTRLLFQHTTTLGVREHVSRRYVLRREMETLETPFGPVRKKRSSGYGIIREKYEYEDLARIARREGISLAEVIRKLDEFVPSGAD